MKFLKLQCAKTISGPEKVSVTINNTPCVIWTVSGNGYVIDYDANGNEIIISGPANYLGLFVYPQYRNLTCNPANPEEDIVFGVADVEFSEGQP